MHKLKSKQVGEPYKTYRLVETERVGVKVKQRIVLNLGRHFEVPQAQWGLLANRINDLLSAKQSLFSLTLHAISQLRSKEKLCDLLMAAGHFFATFPFKNMQIAPFTWSFK